MCAPSVTLHARRKPLAYPKHFITPMCLVYDSGPVYEWVNSEINEKSIYTACLSPVSLLACVCLGSFLQPLWFIEPLSIYRARNLRTIDDFCPTARDNTERARFAPLFILEQDNVKLIDIMQALCARLTRGKLCGWIAIRAFVRFPFALSNVTYFHTEYFMIWASI